MTLTLRKLHSAVESACPGRVITPDDARYDDTRLLFNGMHDRRPALICLPRTQAEIQASVRAARHAGVRTAVRGAGHNVAGSSSVDEGLVIDLRLMNTIAVDPARRIARVGGGTTWAEFDRSTVRCGLATTGGTFDTTGVGGLTLGGGIGHLMGSYGLSCDNVLSYSLVTADGKHRQVTPESDPELDWALRGAGHNFGIVDEFTFQLHPVTHVYGGYVAYPVTQMHRAIRLFRDLMTEAPNELVCTLLLERYGAGQAPAAVMSVCYRGDDDAYVATLNKQLRIPEVLDWQIRPRSYLSMQQALGSLPYGLRHYWSAVCVDAMPDKLVDALVDRFLASKWTDPFNDTILVEPIHGAVREVPDGTSAVPFRSAHFNITGMSIWRHSDADAEQVAWARSVPAAAQTWNSTGDGYINYVSDAFWGNADVPSRAERTYGSERHSRLLTLKHRIDPDNFFRANYNLDPQRA